MRSSDAVVAARHIIDRRRNVVAGMFVAIAVGGLAAAAFLLADPAPMPLLHTQARFEGSLGLPSSVEALNEPGAMVDAAVPAEALASATIEVEPDPVDASAWTGNDAGTRWFNGRPIRPAYTMTMVVTAYSPDERSCGDSADGITASGYSVWTNGMRMVAADTSVLPFGALVSVPGYDSGEPVPVLDRGGAIKGKRLDVLYATHEQARQWGVQELEVIVWEYADGAGCDFRTAHRRR